MAICYAKTGYLNKALETFKLLKTDQLDLALTINVALLRTLANYGWTQIGLALADAQYLVEYLESGKILPFWLHSTSFKKSITELLKETWRRTQQISDTHWTRLGLLSKKHADPTKFEDFRSHELVNQKQAIPVVKDLLERLEKTNPTSDSLVDLMCSTDD